ncbi:MAG: hypothetical protein AAB486_04050 [Patescibacteria group bacterium]
MNLNRKLLPLILVYIFLLTGSTGRVYAQAEDIYRTIILQKSNALVETPIKRESNLLFNSQPVPTESRDQKKWFAREIDFTLNDRADFIKLTFDRFPYPYAFGTLKLSRQNGSHWDEVDKRNILRPDSFINPLNLDPGRYLLQFSFEDPGFSNLRATVAAYSYVSDINLYDPAKAFIFTSSTAKRFGDSFWPLLKSRNIILICEDPEPFRVFGDTCSLGNVKTTGPGAHTVFSSFGKPLVAIPDWNHRTLLLSPRAFFDEARVKTVTSFLTFWLGSGVHGVAKDIGGDILDLYWSLLDKIWVWVFLAVAFLLLVSVRIVSLDRKLLINFSVFKLLRLPVNLLLGFVRKYRWLFFLTFIVSSGCFIAVFYSKGVLESLLSNKSLETLYRGYRQGLVASSLGVLGIRHILEVVFINISVLAIFLTFSDKLFFPAARYSHTVLKFVGRRRYYFDALCVFLFGITLTVRIIGTLPRLEVSVLTVLLTLLLFRELSLALKPRPDRPTADPRWLLLLFLLLFLIPVSGRVQQHFFKTTVPVTAEDSYVVVDKAFGLRGLKLPLSPNKLPVNAEFSELKVNPNGVLLAGKYLIGYPGAGKISYATSASGSEVLTDKRMALYSMNGGMLGADQSEVLKSLGRYVVPESFRATRGEAREIRLPRESQPRKYNYLFYTYLFRGENTFALDYTPLNLSPRPGFYTLNLLDSSGDAVSSLSTSGQQYSGTFAVDSDGIYILEIAYNNDPSFLGVSDYAILNSINFPSNSVYFLDVSSVGTPLYYPQKNDISLSGADTLSPFSFRLVSFGEFADEVLILNPTFNLTIESDNGVINLGVVLTALSRTPDGRQRLQVHYQDGSPLLFISK